MNRVRVQTQYHTQGDGDDRRVLGGLKFSVQGIFFWGGGGGGGLDLRRIVFGIQKNSEDLR